MNRHGQKRQTAGTLVQGLWSKPKKKNSTAKPRPEITIAPRGIGPVYDLNPNDVLCGRGGRINAHAGNVQFRDIVSTRKKDYLAKTTKKLEKAHIAAEVVRHIRSMEPAGRFLKADTDGSWWDIGDQKAIKKVGQALREDAPDVRHENSDEEENANSVPKVVKSSTPAKTPTKVATTKAVIQLPVSEANTANGPVPSDAPTPKASASGRYNQTQASGFRGTQFLHQAAGKSGAAAAAMQDDVDPADVAFGRQFHHAEKDNSMLSGISASDMVSDISGLTDPMSTISARMNQQRPGTRPPPVPSQPAPSQPTPSHPSGFGPTRVFVPSGGPNQKDPWDQLLEDNSLMDGASFKSFRDHSLVGGSVVSGMQSVNMGDPDRRNTSRTQPNQTQWQQHPSQQYQQQNFQQQLQQQQQFQPSYQHYNQQQQQVDHQQQEYYAHQQPQMQARQQYPDMAPPPPINPPSYYPSQQSQHQGTAMVGDNMSVASMSMMSMAESVPVSVISALSDTMKDLDLEKTRVD